MSNDLMLFQNEEFGKVRAFDIGGRSLVCG